MNKWYNENEIVCVKEINPFKVGCYYTISGRGNLEFVNSSGKKGPGISIDFKNTEGRIFYTHYLTIKELDEYFVTSNQFEKIWKRDQKIKIILD